MTPKIIKLRIAKSIENLLNSYKRPEKPLSACVERVGTGLTRDSDLGPYSHALTANKVA